jgi:hypothetical protein
MLLLLLLLLLLFVMMLLEFGCDVRVQQARRVANGEALYAAVAVMHEPCVRVWLPLLDRLLEGAQGQLTGQ